MKEKTQLDKDLKKEIISDNPNEENIRSLVAQGANVMGEFLSDAIADLTPYPDEYGNLCGKPIDLKLVQLLIDLGGEINFEDGGFNCLFHAALVWNPELFKLLVSNGANMNCFSDDEYTSLFSWIDYDQWYEENEMTGGGKPLAEIVEFMKQNGAKSNNECFAERPERYISINALRIVAMVTMGGQLSIEKIPGASQQLIEEFNEWHKSSHQEWMQEKIKGTGDEWRWKSPPDLVQLVQHKEQGIALAKQIKELVGSDITVDYYPIEPDSIKEYRKIQGYIKIRI
jgi:hypothetical protein